MPAFMWAPPATASDLYPSLLRFLQENGLSKTAKALRKEAGVEEEAGNEAPELLRVVQEGWPKPQAAEEELPTAGEKKKKEKGKKKQEEDEQEQEQEKKEEPQKKERGKKKQEAEQKEPEQEVEKEEQDQPPAKKEKKRKQEAEQEVEKEEKEQPPAKKEKKRKQEAEQEVEQEEKEPPAKKEKKRKNAESVEKGDDEEEEAAGAEQDLDLELPPTPKKKENQSEEKAKKSQDEASSGREGKKSNNKGPKPKGVPFQREDWDKWADQIKDQRLKDNSHLAKNGDTWANKAAVDLLAVRGKGFRKEMAKKKRASWRGGGILDQGVNSIKFDSDSD